MLGSISADTCSLLYSYLGFVLSLLSYVGGYYMEVNVVVVIGFKMCLTQICPTDETVLSDPIWRGLPFYIRADTTIKIPFPTLISASSAAHWLLIPMGNVLVTTPCSRGYFPPVMHTSSQVSDAANTDKDHPSRRGRVMLPSVKK